MPDKREASHRPDDNRNRSFDALPATARARSSARMTGRRSTAKNSAEDEGRPSMGRDSNVRKEKVSGATNAGRAANLIFEFFGGGF